MVSHLPTVLVVEDSSTTRRLVRVVLEREGFDVLEAETSRAAIELVRGRDVGVVLLDLRLTDASGFDLALAIRELRPEASLIAMSALVEEIDPAEFAAVEFDDIVAKPVESTTLVRAVRGRPALRSSAPPGSLTVELSQRYSRMNAELAILQAVSEAVAQHEDVERALDDVLKLCFDAGGVALGALYVVDDRGKASTRVIGSRNGDLSTVFERHACLVRLSQVRSISMIGSGSDEELSAVLKDIGARVAVVVPLWSGEISRGALLVAPTRGEPILDEWLTFVQALAGQIVHALLLGCAFDARRLAEGRAMEQEAAWRALVENAPDLILSTDAAGRVRWANRSLPDGSVDELVGLSCFSLFDAACRAELETELHEVLRSGSPRTCEVTRSAPGAEQAWYSIHLGPVGYGASGAVGAILIARDVSSRKRAEAQLMVADRMVSVGTLAGGVAHEVNNPLASIIANVELASEELAPLVEAGVVALEVQEALGDALEAAGRVAQVVRDLKVFAGAEDERRGPVDVEKLLDSMLRAAGNEIRHRARLRKSFAGVPGIVANEARLGQVFLNLLMNAVQAIPEGRADKNEIGVTTSAGPKGSVVIEISDTGVGMSPEVRARLFTPFFTTKPVGEGTGLGLSLSRRIVTDLGGEISAESEPGRGSTFRVELPSARARPLPVPPSVRPAGRRASILVVDDEPMIGRALQRALEPEHDVLAVSHAYEALSLIRQGRRFDVVFCDLMMPDLSGMDFHREVERLAPEMLPAVVYVTGGAFTPLARKFLDTIPNQRMEKPFDLRSVRNLVRERVAG